MTRTTSVYILSVLSAALLLMTHLANAQQVQRMVGDRIMMARSFCPAGSWPAEGQKYNFNVNAALFAKFYDESLGVRDAFFLPDLRGGPLTQCIIFTKDFESQRYLGEVYESESTCPSGSVAANGKTYNIGEALSLFGLIGTSYGGDGVKDFKIPNLNGIGPFYCLSINGLYPMKESADKPRG
jgi:microcystin-dependent protein